jgi:hypothetical protein
MNYKHGCTVVKGRDSSNPEWRAHVSWLKMKSRCLDHNNKDFMGWGGRGISFDPRWAEFAAFYADMGAPPDGLTLDRIDNNAGYSKANCRWATRKEQNRNKRSNHYLTFNGESRIISEWAEHLGVASRLLRVRLNRGWSVERTLSTPLGA